MSYATDGKCHNAQPGTFSHECGAPAQWTGTTANGFKSGFCDDCKQYGWEARDVVSWEAIQPTEAIAIQDGGQFYDSETGKLVANLGDVADSDMAAAQNARAEFRRYFPAYTIA